MSASRHDGRKGRTSFQSTPEQALAHAFKLLGLRSHSRRELGEKLQRKGFEETHTARALERLMKLGLLDDRAFGLEFLQSRSRQKPAGRLKLQMELQKHGLERDLVDELLRDYDAKGPCLRAAEKKLRTLGSAPGPKEREKLIRFLSGRGFMWEEIREALNELLTENGEGYA
ncbi:recombination regulator RecX [Chlorobium sp. N1]|uniref:recombination regulator RecX n=1 Tax=Chlorobium sp. N1 TaxID=2491138 RepID=UPI00103C22C6|nr:recombination regulator RecX [Chlorobium sp. N1]TCD47578.1 recombination regulator RecX [Chlorobium sp. N1]